MRTGTWNDFKRDEKGEPLTSDSDDLAVLTARLFSTPEGQEWLETQRAIKFGASVAPDISESALRHFNGQMQFLRDIDRMIARGQAILKRPKEVK